MESIIKHNTLMLAPLAGYSDLPLREVAKTFGADITVSEMVSVHALAFKNQKTLKMVEKSPLENPFALQIAGNDFGVIQRAVEYLNTQTSIIQILDFNCGCPAPKVSSHGSGSALLKDLKRLVSLLTFIREISKIPYLSVKVRLGFESKIPLEIAQALRDAPIDYLVVHGRTKADGYKKEKIDYAAIALMKQNLKVPLIANGELNSVQKVRNVLEQTGADGVMIGRAAVEKPWIFAQIKEGLIEEDLELRARVALEHFERVIRFRGNYGSIMFRKNLHAYAKGLKGASEFRSRVNAIVEPTLMREAIVEFFTATEFES